MPWHDIWAPQHQISNPQRTNILTRLLLVWGEETTRWSSKIRGLVKDASKNVQSGETNIFCQNTIRNLLDGGQNGSGELSPRDQTRVVIYTEILSSALWVDHSGWMKECDIFCSIIVIEIKMKRRVIDGEKLSWLMTCQRDTGITVYSSCIYIWSIYFSVSLNHRLCMTSLKENRFWRKERKKMTLITFSH